MILRNGKHHRIQVFAALVSLSAAACVFSPKFEGYTVTQRDGWIFYETEEALLPPLPANYVDPGPPIGLSSPVQRQFVYRARDFASARLKEAQLCPIGFSGPDLVLTNRTTHSLQFRVRCLEDKGISQK